jgi:hypothetical protein
MHPGIETMYHMANIWLDVRSRILRRQRSQETEDCAEPVFQRHTNDQGFS